MREELRRNFEEMLKNGDHAEAEIELKRIMEQAPDDRDAKMLYGTCRMLQGDTETAKRIHDELWPGFSGAGDIPARERTFWEKYHNWIIYGSVAALVIGGVVKMAKEASKSFSEIIISTPEAKKYAGPPIQSYGLLKYAGPPKTYYCKKCGNPTKIGWGWIEDEKYRAELSAKVGKGLIPCKTCGKDTPYKEDNPYKESEW